MSTGKWFGKAFLSLFNKEIDWLDDDIRGALVTNAYTPDQDVHDYWDDVVASEASGSGYTANGQALANKTITYTGATNVLKLDADDLLWDPSTVTARHVVVYDRTPASDATRPLMGYVSETGDIVSTAGPFTVTWDAAGIATITPA